MEQVNRRSFLRGSLLAAAGAGAAATPAAAPAGESDSGGRQPIIDVNVYLSHWPFRRMPGDETAELVELLRGHGVVRAWTGSFDGVFHKDVAAANTRLADACRTHGRGVLVPFGTVNPHLPDWELDLCRCHEEHRMPGIRLHPNYHGYTLDDPAFVRLLHEAAERRLIVQIVAWMEDERHRHPLMPVPAVNPAPLAQVLRDVPDVRIVLLNAVHVPQDKRLTALAATGQVYFDLAKLELIEGLAALLRQMPIERLLFGSYSPMFYFESTLLKLPEAGLNEAQTDKILRANAAKLLPASSGEVGPS